jgi:hypothetical protein
MAISYNPRTITDGLVLCLDAGNSKSYPGSGTTWTDLIGNRQGTINNSPIFNGNHFSFDGVNENVSFSSSVEVSTAGFTMGFLMRVVDLQNGTGWNFMLADKDTGNGSFEMGIYANTTRNFIFKDNDQTIGQQVVSTALGTDWNFLVFGMTSDLYPFIYLNGAFKIQLGTTFTSAILDFTQLMSYNSAGHFKCDCSYINLYNRALTAAEIQQNYNALKSRFGLP